MTTATVGSNAAATDLGLKDKPVDFQIGRQVYIITKLKSGQGVQVTADKIESVKKHYGSNGVLDSYIYRTGSGRSFAVEERNGHSKNFSLVDSFLNSDRSGSADPIDNEEERIYLTPEAAQIYINEVEGQINSAHDQASQSIEKVRHALSNFTIA